MDMYSLATDVFGDVVRHAVHCLRRGGVIVCPTETVYGLMTLWSNRNGQDRIYEMKGRDRKNPLQMLAHDLDSAVAAGVKRSSRLERLVEEFCPGPLTIVCPGGEPSSIGVRFPDHPLVQRLLQELGEPLAATSANASGKPATRKAGEAVDGLLEMPDMLIDGGDVGEPVASTVVSIMDAVPRILRAGPITQKDIDDALGQGSLF